MMASEGESRIIITPPYPWSDDARGDDDSQLSIAGKTVSGTVVTGSGLGVRFTDGTWLHVEATCGRDHDLSLDWSRGLSDLELHVLGAIDDAEWGRRQAAEGERRERDRQDREERERRHYEWLKAKFEGVAS